VCSASCGTMCRQTLFNVQYPPYFCLQQPFTLMCCQATVEVAVIGITEGLVMFIVILSCTAPAFPGCFICSCKSGASTAAAAAAVQAVCSAC